MKSPENQPHDINIMWLISCLIENMPAAEFRLDKSSCLCYNLDGFYLFYDNKKLRCFNIRTYKFPHK